VALRLLLFGSVTSILFGALPSIVGGAVTSGSERGTALPRGSHRLPGSVMAQPIARHLRPNAPVPLRNARPRRHCPARTARGSMTMPPKGFAAVVTTTVEGDCSLITSHVHIVALGKLEKLAVRPEPQLHPTPARPASPAASTTQATVHQRLWDIAGIRLNEFDTVASWQSGGGRITYYSAHNEVAYHRELIGGWNLDYQNIWVASGGVNQGSVGFGANAGFSYRGLFDPTGSIFYNTYNNSLTAYWYGGWKCGWAYTWRNSFPGWHTQNWCAYGGA